MKKRLSILFLLALLAGNLSAQVLTLNQITQEQNQWCWAGVSKCVLDYYNHSLQQCEIAEYTRTVATWHSFGTEGCCINPSGACNYWNYNWGSNGSIQDILVHFASIQNVGKGTALTQTEVQTEVSNGRPFIIRWGWTTGGGHFIVGHGIKDGMLYYMNPWYGEGLKIATYDWVKSNADHTWTHTNVITSILPFIALSTNSLTIDAAANSTKVFTINSNANWTVTTDQTWLSVNSSNGNGNATITITATANTTSASRTATVSVAGTGITTQILKVTQSNTTGIDELSNNQDVEIFPNPSNGKFNISLKNYEGVETFIIVSNSLGNAVKEIKLVDLPANYSQEIDLSNFADGVYYIAVQTSKTKEVRSIVLLK